jgi:undecaprenyl-diphosphatase
MFKNINGLAGKSKILDALAIFCAKYLLFLMLAFLFLYAFDIRSLRVFFFPLASGVFAAFVLNTIIYIFYKEKRPAGLKSTNTLIAVPSNPSFPSRHSSLVFGISFCLFFYNISLAIIFLAFSCLVAIARVFCGVHWLRDVLAGSIVGFISSLIIYNVLTYIFQ